MILSNFVKKMYFPFKKSAENLPLLNTLPPLKYFYILYSILTVYYSQIIILYSSPYIDI